MISIPDPAAGTLAAALKLRTDASQILGVDVDLVLGPVVGTEGAAARQARMDAFADMVDTGFIWPQQINSRGRAVAEQLRELDELELAAGLIDLDLGAVA
ncbi:MULTISPECIES: hypothetical protein [Actinomycetes]|uniref:Uncharacterized protein n=1 Tax=Streptomyces acidiscabies TaxID=42234 RepID=A0ABU4MB36_9ACTN|nr:MULTISPECIES: hypothetical protein [Actinomycetes]MDX2974020.1 hypothetical protein [Kribbella solani]MDX3025339.1 hypothetical protein [Streptomyces acidiscabies]